ncbi:MAG: cytochrome C [Paludibacter sp.]|nr:cytochrome C [Paludibacter sp.]
MRVKNILFPLGLLFLFLLKTSAQISPGDLSKSHSSLDGVSNCTKCHSLNNKVTRDKCLDCHKEIKALIVAKKGYHASSEVLGKECSSCHNDHHGREFKMVRLNKKLFNHKLTGFTLTGKHAKLECNSCHKAEFIKDPDFKKKASTYMGLNQNCLSCHDDYHQGKLSSKCASCHNFDSFKNATGFDHSKTRFPLLGKHKNVDCLKCHKTETVNGKVEQNFKGLKFGNCNECHQDVHENKLGKNCKQCHSEESFYFNKNMKAFNHDKTNFKLVGKHKQVDCNSCHKKKLTTAFKHNRCTDCHTDYHKGDFKVNGKSPDCDECHTLDGFALSTYSLEKHNKKFVLDGAHEATLCQACHKKPSGLTFKNMGKNCIDCHKNIHKGYIEEKFMPNNDCSACHNTKNWTSVKFDHNRTNYKLEGKHAEATCDKCHYGKNEKGQRTQQFAGISQECSSCHKDSHVGQFAVNGKTDCAKCHGFDNWESTKFDHMNSRFALDGAHQTVACDECHKPEMNTLGKYVKYKFNDISCASCHK